MSVDRTNHPKPLDHVLDHNGNVMHPPIDPRIAALESELADLRERLAVWKETLEACRVFITPMERLRHWDEYKQFAAARILDAMTGNVPQGQ